MKKHRQLIYSLIAFGIFSSGLFLTVDAHAFADRCRTNWLEVCSSGSYEDEEGNTIEWEFAGEKIDPQ